MLHADPGNPAIVDDDDVVGHNAIVHGCVIENGCLFGMGAPILNGARLGGALRVLPERCLRVATRVRGPCPHERFDQRGWHAQRCY